MGKIYCMKASRLGISHWTITQAKQGLRQSFICCIIILDNNPDSIFQLGCQSKLLEE